MVIAMYSRKINFERVHLPKNHSISPYATNLVIQRWIFEACEREAVEKSTMWPLNEFYHGLQGKSLNERDDKAKENFLKHYYCWIKTPNDDEYKYQRERRDK